MSKKSTNIGSINIEAGSKQPSYWWLENAVGNSFNRLKGKLFNLAETTFTNEKQCEAFKGLIKDFANNEYKVCVEQMRYEAKQANIYPINDEIEAVIAPMEVHLDNVA